MEQVDTMPDIDSGEETYVQNHNIPKSIQKIPVKTFPSSIVKKSLNDSYFLNVQVPKLDLRQERLNTSEGPIQPIQVSQSMQIRKLPRNRQRQKNIESSFSPRDPPKGDFEYEPGQYCHTERTNYSKSYMNFPSKTKGKLPQIEG